jgi:hypothetical protein
MDVEMSSSTPMPQSLPKCGSPLPASPRCGPKSGGFRAKTPRSSILTQINTTSSTTVWTLLTQLPRNYVSLGGTALHAYRSAVSTGCSQSSALRCNGNFKHTFGFEQNFRVRLFSLAGADYNMSSLWHLHLKPRSAQGLGVVRNCLNFTFKSSTQGRGSLVRVRDYIYTHVEDQIIVYSAISFNMILD